MNNVLIFTHLNSKTVIMKRIIFTVLISFILIGASFAQKFNANKLPAAVKQAFAAKFQNVSNASWELEDRTIYKVTFLQNNNNMFAVFNQEGIWIETKTTINVSELPVEVQKSIASEFEGYNINKAVKVERFDKGIRYGAELSKGNETFDALFEINGKFSEKSAIK